MAENISQSCGQITSLCGKFGVDEIVKWEKNLAGFPSEEFLPSTPRIEIEQPAARNAVSQHGSEIDSYSKSPAENQWITL